MLEVASLICDETVHSELSYASPLQNDLDVGDFLLKSTILSMSGYFSTSTTTNDYYAVTLTEDGLCMTYNPIDANFIFRNETVDPKFINEYQLVSNGIDPQFWSMDEGYDSSRIEFDNYPIRVFDNDEDNGYTIYVRATNGLLENIDPVCRKNPTNIHIALHHPAEVVSKRFYLIPFNKSVSFAVKPQITKTSEGLKLYEPSV